MFYRLKTALKKKIGSQAGDSIAEVLVALLISSLALVMLASMITSSSKIITASKTKMQDYYSESSGLISPPNNPGEIQISSVKLGINSSEPQKYDVNYYVSAEFPKVLSFQKK